MAFSPTEKALRELGELQKLIEDFRTDLDGDGKGAGRDSKRIRLFRRAPRASRQTRRGSPVG
jgi:hypothetical protein